MPVRKVSNHGRNIIGYFPSIKMGRMVAFESTIERDLIYLLDFADQVHTFSEQPCVISYLDGDIKRTYTPDFQLQLCNRCQVMIECKPEAVIDLEANQRQFNAGRAWAEAHSWKYEIITDEWLRAGCRLQNIKFLTRYARHQIPFTLKDRILHILSDVEAEVPVRELAYAVSVKEPALGLAAIFQMTFYHELRVALHERQIDLDTKVKQAPSGESKDEHASLFSW